MKYYHIEDFPQDKIRVLLTEDYRKKFWKALKSLIGSDEKIAKIVGYPRTVITKMRQGKNSRCTTYFLPLSMIIEFSKILVNNDFNQFDLRKIEKHIKAYKTQSTSSVITNPNLPLPEDERLIRIFTHLIGDGYGGGIYKNPKRRWNNYVNPQYTNINEKLVNKFIENLKVFGNVPYNKKNKWNCFKVIIPLSIKYILEHIYKIKISASKEGLPLVFFTLPKKLMYHVIRAFCDDEGHVNDNSISVSSGNKRQLEDLRKLMIKAGFNEKNISQIKPIKKNTYSLTFRRDNFVKFYRIGGFLHPEKQKILEFQINRHKYACVRTSKEVKNRIVGLLKNEKLTSIELAMRLGISQRWTSNYLKELIKSGTIEKFFLPGKNKIAYKLKE